MNFVIGMPAMLTPRVHRYRILLPPDRTPLHTEASVAKQGKTAYALVATLQWENGQLLLEAQRTGRPDEPWTSIKSLSH